MALPIGQVCIVLVLPALELKHKLNQDKLAYPIVDADEISPSFENQFHPTFNAGGGNQQPAFCTSGYVKLYRL